MSNPIFMEVMTLLAISVVAVVVFQRLRMPSSLGYLLVGALVGPHAIKIKGSELLNNRFQFHNDQGVRSFNNSDPLIVVD